MPLVIQGATSGQATVQATDAQTVTITLPATSGTLAIGGTTPTFSTLTVTGDASINGLTVGKGAGGGAANTAFGVNAIPSAPNSGVTAIGNNAGAAYTSALGTGQATFVGYRAGASTTSGVDNTFIGGAAGTSNTTGATNTAVGSQAMQLNTTGSFNVAIGYQSGYSNTTGTSNNGVGYKTLYTNTGSANNAFGESTLSLNTTGSYNSAFGHSTLLNNTTGGTNTAFGTQALQANTTASNNTAVGYQAGYAGTTAKGNTLIGTVAGAALTTGSRNTFIGPYWDTYTVGAGSLMTTGSNNTIVGLFSGNDGGLDIRTASNYIVLADGSGNPRLIVDDSGNVNISNGISASTASGLLSLYSSTNNTTLYIKTNVTAEQVAVNLSNPNGSVGSIKTNGSSTSFNTSSDYRLKEDVSPMTGALAKVSALKPVTYKWKVDGSIGEGFIAHELAEVCPLAVSGEKDAVNEDGSIKPQGIDTSFLVATLTAAIQELSAKVDAQAAEIAALKGAK